MNKLKDDLTAAITTQFMELEKKYQLTQARLNSY